MTDTEISRGTRVREARKFIGWSQNDLAIHLRTAQSVISCAERDAENTTDLVWMVLGDFVRRVNDKLVRPGDEPTPREVF